MVFALVAKDGHAAGAPAGNNGAVSYRNDVVPLLSRAGCNMGACHGNASGKGGFRLSLRGDDPSFDFQSLTRDALGRRINTAAAERSLILLKPTGQVPHEGGIRFAPNSPEVRALRAWIAGGAPDDVDRAPRLKSLNVSPQQLILQSAEQRAKLQITAEFDDGTTRDVTRQAALDVSNPALGDISPEGTVRARRPCELTVAVRYLRGRGVSRLTFLADRPNYVWSGPAEVNTVDTHAFSRMRTLRINPSTTAPDPVFLRRAFLDAIGRLPAPEEARAFQADRDPVKRSRMIARLLDRPEFADFWALKWADLLRNEEKTMGAKGVWVFQRWLRDEIAAGVPLDRMVRRIVASQGSTWTNPPSSFYRTNRDPMTAAETVAQVFLGIRIQCARCHNHPFDDWTQDDYYGLAACFANVKRKELTNLRRDGFDKHEINGDEVIWLASSPPFVQPRTGKPMTPRPLHAPVLASDDAAGSLDQLADWLTRNNRQFARNLANRVWFHLMGRGIVEPVDDFRESNPPSDPALLESLTDALLSNNMQLKPLVALVMKSQTYQLSAAPEPDHADEIACFSRAEVRLLSAEVLLDAISQVLDVPDRFPNAPRSFRAAQLAGVASENAFLKAFGKPERLLTCECERIETTTLTQAFQMINGESVRRKLESPSNRIARHLEANTPAEAILEELYLAALCRQPTSAERQSMLAHVKKAARPRDAWQDVVWAIINSKEFLLRH
jgi:hypothetical protein